MAGVHCNLYIAPASHELIAGTSLIYEIYTVFMDYFSKEADFGVTVSDHHP